MTQLESPCQSFWILKIAAHKSHKMYQHSSRNPDDDILNSDQTSELTPNHGLQYPKEPRESIKSDKATLHHHSGCSKWTVVFTDCLVVIPTLGLLVFVSLVAASNGREVDENYDRYRNALTVVRHDEMICL